MTALTVKAVIIASPIPIKIWVPTIAPKTVVIEKVAVAPSAYWKTNPTAAIGTEIKPAIAEAIAIEDLFFGRQSTT